MSIENENDLAALRRVGGVVARALAAMRAAVRPGITTGELDRIGQRELARSGATPAPRAVYGFPGATCISVNDEAVHGIPGARMLEAGDLVKLDVTAELDGYYADAALTVPIPPVSATAAGLERCARAAFARALRIIRAGARLVDIGAAVDAETKRHGFHVLRALGGHGIGRTIHEPPTVPNYPDRGVRGRLTNGLVLALEPIVAAGTWRCVEAPDRWTVRSADGSLTAHYEHTIVVTEGRPIVLTAE